MEPLHLLWTLNRRLNSSKLLKVGRPYSNEENMPDKTFVYWTFKSLYVQKCYCENIIALLDTEATTLITQAYKPTSPNFLLQQYIQCVFLCRNLDSCVQSLCSNIAVAVRKNVTICYSHMHFTLYWTHFVKIFKILVC